MTINFDRRYQILGHPIPDSIYAVSVALPTHAATIAYEEGDPTVHSALRGVYPRFGLHPLINELLKKYQPLAEPGEVVWVFPSFAIASEAKQFVGTGRVQATKDGIALLFVPETNNQQAQYFWQHTGEIVSPRQAEAILRSSTSKNHDELKPLKEMVATYNNADSDDVFLYPTGMAAIFNAYKAIVCNRGNRTIQLGFPYTDTLKIQEKFGQGKYVPYNSPNDLDALEQILKHEPVTAVFCEIPGNPLLRTIDLDRLNPLLDRYNVPLIIDDTLGTPFDVDVKRYAAATVTSLTKYFSGAATVMGGAITLNPESPYYRHLKAVLTLAPTTLYGADAAVLLETGKNFFRRMQQINPNAEALADFLRSHGQVESVFYPKGDPAYETIRRPAGGYGGLLSFQLKEKEKTAGFFDNLDVAKGPSLGTEFTLCCLFTLLAHYHERPWAQAQQVPEHLIRVAVRTEPKDSIIKRFNQALSHAVPNG